MTKTIKQNVEVAKFKKQPRSNLLIEIFRFIALVGLVMNHIGGIPGLDHVGGFVSFVSTFFGKTINVFPFIVVTGIFTIGKGKDYFLRNLSRFIFVLVLVWTIALPIYYSNEGSLTLGKVIMGGGSAWYLWQILILALIFPLIKIDKFLKKSRTLNVVAAVLMVLPFSFFSDGLITSFIMLFCIGLSAYILKFTLDQWNVKRKTKILVFGIITLILFAFGTWTGVWYQEKWVSRYTNISLIVFLALIPLPTPKWFSWIVHNTYFVYEFHFLFLLATKHIFFAMDRHSFQTQTDVWEFFAIAATMSIIASYLISQLQTRLWEPIVGDRFIYRIKPLSRSYWMTFGLYLAVYLAYTIAAYIGLLD